MAEDHNQRPLKEFSQPSNEKPSSSIVNPAITTNKTLAITISSTKPIRWSRYREPESTLEGIYPIS